MVIFLGAIFLRRNFCKTKLPKKNQISKKNSVLEKFHVKKSKKFVLKNIALKTKKNYGKKISC